MIRFRASADITLRSLLTASGQLRKQDTKPETHIFIAGPNAFVSFLGQNQPAIGPIIAYEWVRQICQRGLLAPFAEALRYRPDQGRFLGCSGEHKNQARGGRGISRSVGKRFKCGRNGNLMCAKPFPCRVSGLVLQEEGVI